MLTRHFHHLAVRVTMLSLIVLTIAGAMLSTPVAQAHAAAATRIHVVAIQAHDNGKDNKAFRGSFSMRSTVPTGLVEFQFTNRGSQDHMAQFFLLKPGVSTSLFIRRLTPLFTSQNPKVIVPALKALLRIASAAGGPNSVRPGASQSVIERLQAGHYVTVCFDSTSDGVVHFMRGMVKDFWASANVRAPVDTDERIVGGAPASNGTVFEFDHQIIVPRVIHKSHPLLLRVAVNGQTHELGLLRVPAGTTKSNLLKCLSGPPSGCPIKGPITDAGGTSSIAPGTVHWVELNLRPGTYAALCFVPDINTGMPHALMGMITVFTVTR